MTRDVRPITLEEIEAGMSPEQRARVDRLSAQMRAEEMSLAQIRKARAVTQAVLARRLGKSQALVSHIEHAGDLFISTLRTQVEALGGELDIRANFPDMPTVSISGFVGTAIESAIGEPAKKKRLVGIHNKSGKWVKGMFAGQKHDKTGKGTVRRKSPVRTHRAAMKG